VFVNVALLPLSIDAMFAFPTESCASRSGPTRSASAAPGAYAADERGVETVTRLLLP